MRLTSNRPVLALAAVAAAVFPFAPNALAVNGTWTNLAGGLYNTTTNWSGGVVANGTDANANFGALNIIANTAIHMNGPHTLGSVIFADTTPSNNWLLDNNGSAGNILTLSTTGTTAATIQVSNQTATIGLTLAGSGAGINKSGSGSLIITVPSTYVGPLAVNKGSLITGVANAFPTNTPLTVAVDSTFNLNGNNQTLLTIGGVGTITNSATATATLTVGNGTNFSSSNILSGALNLTKTGSGAMTLATAASYTGTTTINQGTLMLGVANALPISNNLSIPAATGTFDLAGFNQQLGHVISNGTIINSKSTAGTLTIDTTFNDNAIVELDGNLSLVKTGTGTLLLTNGAYVGSTTISGGTLKLNAANALPIGSTTIDAAGTLDLNGKNQSILSIAGVGTVTNAATVAATLTLNSFNCTALLTGNMNLTKTGVDTLTLNTAATYTGSTNISLGTLANGVANALPVTTTLTVLGAATFDLNGNNQTVAGVSANGAVTNSTTTAATLTIDTSVVDNSMLALSGNLSLAKAGTGTLSLAPASYTGNTSVSGGSLRSSGNNAIPVNSAVTINNGNFDLNGHNQQLSSIAGTGSVTNSSSTASTLILLANAPINSSNLLTGNLGLDKKGFATVTLNTPASYTQPTLIEQGSLLIGANNTLPTGGSIAVNIGAVFDLNGFNQEFASIQGPGNYFNSSSVAGTLTVNNPALLNSSAHLTGNFSLIKKGAGTIAFSSAEIYTGDTTIMAGTVQFSAPASINAVNGAGNLTVSASVATGPVKVNTFSVTTGGNATIRVNGGPGSVSVVNGLAIDGVTNAWSGKLNLTNNDMIIHSATGDASTVINQIQQGFNHGDWNGTGGITSTSARNSLSTSTAKAIAYMTGAEYQAASGQSTFDGQAFANTDILLKYTLAGDATLDGQVTIADFLALQNNFNQTGKDYAAGDFNYDGQVTIADFLILQNNFNKQLETPAVANLLSAFGAANGVPEPASLACLIPVVLLFKRRR